MTRPVVLKAKVLDVYFSANGAFSIVGGFFTTQLKNMFKSNWIIFPQGIGVNFVLDEDFSDVRRNRLDVDGKSVFKKIRNGGFLMMIP